MSISLAPYRPVSVPLQRIGREGDGGYVVPKAAVRRARTLLSIGVGHDLSFDLAFAKENSAARIVALDGTVSAKRLALSILSGPVRSLHNVVIKRRPRQAVACIRKMRREADALVTFARLFGWPGGHLFVEQNLAHIQAPGLWTLHDALQAARTAGPSAQYPDAFLKMDIEGGEYDVALDVLQLADRFAGLLIEWHDLDTRWEDFEARMRKLLAEFAVVHLHGNNNRPLIEGTAVPSVMEVSMISRRLLGHAVEYRDSSYPRAELDFPNDPSTLDFPLDFRG